MRMRARRLAQIATCLVLACSLSAVAGDDDDDKPAVAGPVAPEAALTIRTSSIGWEFVVARPLEAKIPDSVDSQGVVLDTATLVSDFGEMTSAAIVERSMKAEVIRLQGFSPTAQARL